MDAITQARQREQVVAVVGATDHGLWRSPMEAVFPEVTEARQVLVGSKAFEAVLMATL